MLPVRTLAVATLAAALGFQGAPAGAQAPAAPSAATLRALYFQQDYAGALAAGRALLADRNAPPEAVAWLVASMAADGRVDDARAAADALERRHVGDGWANFARAIARVPPSGFAGEALTFAARARAGGLDPEMVWLHATVYHRTHSPARAVALLDSLAALGIGSPELLVLRGELEAARALDRGEGTPARALGTFDAALRVDSGTVSAWLGRARMLEATGSTSGAYEALRRARDLAPLSVPVHVAFWRAALARADVPVDSARREVQADAASLQRARPGWASTLRAQGRLFRMLGESARADSVEAELTARHAGSFEAEDLALERLERAPEVGRSGVDSAAAAAERKARLWEFVSAPGRHPASLARAYAALLELAHRDTTVAGADMSRIAEGIDRYGAPDPRRRFWPVVLLLAERHGDPSLTETLARQIPAHVAAEDRAILVMSPDTSLVARIRLGERADAEGQARLHDALGWLRLGQDRLEDADGEMKKAQRELGDDPVILFHAARLAERRDQPDEAEQLYVRALTQDGAAAEPRIDSALRALYARRHGSLAGFDTVVAAARARQREARRTHVLSERMRSPRKAPAFRLARLEGGTYSSDELRGKVAIVNFWGTWCPPCREELPLIQRLYQKYRSDPGVALVTIDYDPDPRAVRPFVAARRLGFPVLLDDGFATRNIRGFPTTWFVDRDGRIAYELRGLRVGELDDMVEQLVWRIESLRDTAGTAQKAAPAR